MQVAVEKQFTPGEPKWIRAVWNKSKANIHEIIRQALYPEWELTVIQPVTAFERNPFNPSNLYQEHYVWMEIWRERLAVTTVFCQIPPIKEVADSSGDSAQRALLAVNVKQKIRSDTMRSRFVARSWEEAKRRWHAYGMIQKQALGMYGGFPV